MNRIHVWILAAAFATSAAAFEHSAHFRSGEAPRVDLDVVEASPRPVFETLAEILGRPLNFDSRVDSPLSIRLENVTVRTALLAICESLDCEVELPNGKLLGMRALMNIYSGTATMPIDRAAVQMVDEAVRRSNGKQADDWTLALVSWSG